MGISQYFCFGYHSGLDSMHGKSALVSIWFRMVLTQTITWFTKILSPWHHTKYQFLSGITILICTGRFFDTMIGVDYWYDAFTYIADRRWWILGDTQTDIVLSDVLLSSYRMYLYIMNVQCGWYQCCTFLIGMACTAKSLCRGIVLLFDVDSRRGTKIL